MPAKSDRLRQYPSDDRVDRKADVIEFSPVGTLFEVHWISEYADAHEMYVKISKAEAMLIEARYENGDWTECREHYDIEYLLQRAANGSISDAMSHGIYAGEIDFGITFPGL